MVTVSYTHLDVYTRQIIDTLKKVQGGDTFHFPRNAGIIYNDKGKLGGLSLIHILGIKDLRSDKRIDFVGGIRGLGELKKLSLIHI